MARVRSPNYPAIGLPVAVERVRAIHKGEGKNVVARDALAKLLGYGGLNGGSAGMLSALSKYGLIESVGDGEARITDLAVRIMFAETTEEKRAALEEAAFKPAVFSEIREKWPDRPPSDESLRSFLLRKGFTEGAADQVIQFYREIIDMALLKAPVQNLPLSSESQEATLQTAPATSASPAATSVLPVAAAAPSLPPPSGKPFTIAFDGLVLTGSIAIRSVRDIDRLMKVLQAQKAAFEAMQDDSDNVEPNDAVN